MGWATTTRKQAIPTRQAKTAASFSSQLSQASGQTAKSGGWGSTAAVANPVTTQSARRVSTSSPTGGSSVFGVGAIQGQLPDDSYEFRLVKVGETERAPMAFFEHNGKLVMSGITRNEMEETPVWTYTPGGTVQQASALPEWAESGAAGYSTGDVIHMTPEAWHGMVDYTADSPDGEWTKHDYTHLNPHEYKNLKWGFSTQDADTGNQYMGFGNGDHAGVVINYKNGEWQTFAAPEDMRFPTAVSDITTGPNAGSTLISSSSYGESHLHLVRPDGSVQTLKDYNAWGFAKVDNTDGVAYMALEDGRVMWAPLSDLGSWKECQYEKPTGSVERIEILGEPVRNSQTGRMLFPTRDAEAGATGFYEPRFVDGQVVLKQVAWLGGAGDWAVKVAEVGGQMYVGTGMRTSLQEDLTPGAIYRLEAVAKDGSALPTTSVSPYAGQNPYDGLSKGAGSGRVSAKTAASAYTSQNQTSSYLTPGARQTTASAYASQNQTSSYLTPGVRQTTAAGFTTWASGKTTSGQQAASSTPSGFLRARV